MTFNDLIKQFRIARDDRVQPYLWSRGEILTYINEAINEACERALLIEDKTTADCCQITLVAGQAAYALHASVIKVKRVTYDGRAIEETSVEALDRDDSMWESRNGHPTAFIVGAATIQVAPVPTADTVATTPTLALTVYRKPLTPLDSDTDTDGEPAILPIYHHRLLPWAYSLALRKTDTQAIDMSVADQQEAIFERSFGMRPDANVQRKRRDRRPPVTRINW